MLRLIADNKQIKVNALQFSDGALSYKLEGCRGNEKEWTITVDPTTPVYRIRDEVEVLTDAISHTAKGVARLNLNLPYLPYARADRKFEEGNGIPLENFEMFLSSFDNVTVCDPHNPKALSKILVNYKIKTQLECFKESIPCGSNLNYDYVVAPDKGAAEKSKTLSSYLQVPLLHCDKVRNISTGQIEGMELQQDVYLTGKRVLIPDDILDGGGTFLGLADILRSKGAEVVDLYITHLIAAKGLDLFEKHIDNIYFYHTIGSYVNRTDVMNFNNRK